MNWRLQACDPFRHKLLRPQLPRAEVEHGLGNMVERAWMNWGKTDGDFTNSIFMGFQFYEIRKTNKKKTKQAKQK